MKKLILSLSILGLTFTAFAQSTITDSIQTGAAYSNDVYYSFKNGVVKSAANNEWQLALSIGAFNVAVRTNVTTSSSGDGSVVIYEQPSKDTTKWNNFDTTGYKTWEVLENSDENWELGALNVNSSGQFDYGWGEYDQVSHAVTGNRLYLATVKSGSNTLYKKLWIKSKKLGNWVIAFANLDGSNEQVLTIKSSDYSGKNFAYVSLINNTVIDREPASATWDFVLTRYRAFQPAQSVYYASTGILTNVGVVTAEARGTAVADATLNNFIADTSDNISVIGADWKQVNNQTFQFYVVDSLCYFVKAKDGAFWKLAFTKFAGSSTGNTVFNKTKLTPATGVSTIGNEVKNLTVYPNPASSNITILFDAENSNSNITLVDLSGRLVKQITTQQNVGFNAHHINLNDVNKGIYFLQVNNGNSTSIQKIIVE